MSGFHLFFQLMVTLLLVGFGGYGPASASDVYKVNDEAHVQGEHVLQLDWIKFEELAPEVAVKFKERLEKIKRQVDVITVDNVFHSFISKELIPRIPVNITDLTGYVAYQILAVETIEQYMAESGPVLGSLLNIPEQSFHLTNSLAMELLSMNAGQYLRWVANGNIQTSLGISVPIMTVATVIGYGAESRWGVSSALSGGSSYGSLSLSLFERRMLELESGELSRYMPSVEKENLYKKLSYLLGSSVTEEGVKLRISEAYNEPDPHRRVLILFDGDQELLKTAATLHALYDMFESEENKAIRLESEKHLPAEFIPPYLVHDFTENLKGLLKEHHPLQKEISQFEKALSRAVRKHMGENEAP